MNTYFSLLKLFLCSGNEIYGVYQHLFIYELQPYLPRAVTKIANKLQDMKDFDNLLFSVFCVSIFAECTALQPLREQKEHIKYYPEPGRM